jgi:gamma-carbonic anhydrase
MRAQRPDIACPPEDPLAIRTRTDTVLPTQLPEAEHLQLQAQLQELRQRWPGVILEAYLQHLPALHPEAWVAPGAALVGQVRLAAGASVWYGCVLRADLAPIEIGARSNIQDGTVIHLGDEDPTIVGEDVVVGHRAVLHGCTVEDACLIGIQATVLDGARIGRGSVVGAGAVVTAGMQVPAGSLVLGCPGKVIRPVSSEDFHRALAAKYLRLAHNHRASPR